MSDSYTEYLKKPRYDVSLQKEDELNCYQDFHNCASLSEAKEVAEVRAKETGRAVIIYDRREYAIVHHIPAVVKEVATPQETPVVTKKKKGKK